jgi:hypothetical protein
MRTGTATTGLAAATLGAAQRLGGALGPLLVAGAGIDEAGYRTGTATIAGIALLVAAASWRALLRVR